VTGDRTSRAGGSRDPRIGTLIGGKYLVLERIGAGGMGRVYRAEQRPLGRVVALKIVAVSRTAVPAGSEGSEGDVVEKRFFREASILARLSHPNVVTVYDFGKIDPDSDDPEADRHYYMAMELVSGQSLEGRLQSRGAIPWQETVRIVRQIGRGLHEAHALGIVHRDLKPANVMITRARDGSEIVKLLDFGIGKILADSAGEAEEPALTMDGIFVGSPGYVAPEQVMTGVVDARSDIYSLGVLTYRCLAGQSPFPEHRTAMALMTAHVHETPRSLRAAAAGVPTWLAGLVHRCLEKSPDKRPQSVEDILEELGEHPTGQVAIDRAKLARDQAAPTLDDFDSPGRLGLEAAPEPPTVADRSVSISGPRSIPPPLRRKRPWIWIAPLAVLLVGGGLIALLRMGERSRTEGSTPPEPGAAAARSRERERAIPSVAISAAATASATPSAAVAGSETLDAAASAKPSAASTAATATSVAIAPRTPPATATTASASKKPPTTTAPPPVDIQLSR
jgi:serine/threonine protein kinase